MQLLATLAGVGHSIYYIDSLDTNVTVEHTCYIKQPAGIIAKNTLKPVV